MNWGALVLVVIGIALIVMGVTGSYANVWSFLSTGSTKPFSTTQATTGVIGTTPGSASVMPQPTPPPTSGVTLALQQHTASINTQAGTQVNG